MLNLIERVRDRGLGVVMISQNMEDVRAVADRIVGACASAGTMEFFCRQPPTMSLS